MEIFTKLCQFVKIPLQSSILYLFNFAGILSYFGACLSTFGPLINGVKPISCSFSDASTNVEQGNNYCYHHGSTKFPASLLAKINSTMCIANQEDGDDSISNYTMMPQILFLCGTLFLLPLWLFSKLENGLLADCTKTCEKFIQLDHKLKWFLMKYLCTIFVLCGMLALNIMILDVNMNQSFVTYGVNIVKNYLPEAANVTSPFPCSLFPTIITCNSASYGSAGGVSDKGAMCVLNFNLYYQSFFMILWCYFCFLMIATTLNVFYWMVLGCFTKLRGKLLASKCNVSLDTKQQMCELCDGMSFTKYFVLYYIVKTSNSEFIQEFISDLYIEGI